MINGLFGKKTRRKKSLSSPAKRKLPATIIGVCCLIAGMVGLSVYAPRLAVWAGGYADKTAMSMRAGVSDFLNTQGLTIQSVLIQGRRRTSGSDIRTALAIDAGAPILSYDIHAAQRRLQALAWVRTATIERILPRTIVVRLKERTPIALWQKQPERKQQTQEQYALIDDDGQVFAFEAAETWRHLMLVSGEQAPTHVGALLRILEREPVLMQQVRSAMFIANRRWNIRFLNGIEVKLPEENIYDAWRRLADIHRKYGLLTKHIASIDMRVPERLIIRENANTEPFDAVPSWIPAAALKRV